MSGPGHDFSFWVKWAAAALRDDLHEPEATTIARHLRVSARTARRWIADNRGPPWATRALMAIASGLPTMALEDWHGWSFRRVNGAVRLRGPRGEDFGPEDLAQAGETHRRLAEHERRALAPAQLTWIPIEAPRRAVWASGWPGGSVPTWAQLEHALRSVIAEQTYLERWRGAPPSP